MVAPLIGGSEPIAIRPKGERVRHGSQTAASALEQRLGAAALIAFRRDRLAHTQDLALHLGDIGFELDDRERRQVLLLWRLAARIEILVLHVASPDGNQAIASLARSV